MNIRAWVWRHHVDEPGDTDPDSGPQDANGGEPDPMPWGDGSDTETWWGYFYGYAACHRNRFFLDDPPKPKQPVLPQRAGPRHVVPFKKKRE